MERNITPDPKEGTMKTSMSKPVILIGAFVLILFIMACSISASTANIADAWMATDETGRTRVTTYSPFDMFYAIVDLRNAPDTTNIKAVWTAVNVEGAAPNEVHQRNYPGTRAERSPEASA
jgi:hypothetical protein